MATVRRAVMGMVRRAKLVSKSDVASIGGCRRWYSLPSQMPPTAAEYLDNVGISLAADWATPGIYPVQDAEVNSHVVRSAKFAINEQNNASASQGNLRFMRVLRASSSHSVSGSHKYYVTFEALRGKADMDVYYAEVVHREVSALTTHFELIKCQLVDDSFHYPRDQIRYASSYYIKLHDPQNIIQKMIVIANLMKCLPKKLKMDRPPADVIFDINTFGIVYEYALFAVTTHNKNEDDKAHLKNILWACKTKVHDNWIYRLVLEVINGEKELNAYYAIVKASEDNSLELKEWYLIPRTFLDEKDAEQNPDSDADQNPDSDAKQNLDSDADQNSDSDAEQNPDSDADQNSDSDAEQNPDSDAEQYPDSDAEQNSDSDAEQNSDSDAEQNPARMVGSDV